MPALAKDVVVDRYRVLSRLGSGAMGEVWLAEDVGLGRKVALKILAESHRENPEVRARFVREARAVAAVSHPNVVQVFTTGEFDGRPFLAMEYLPGHDLGSVVRQGGPIDSRRAAGIVHDVARGLSAAARAGLIHRDVKPSNLMLLPDGTVKVTDFGLAKPVTPGDDPALTALGVVVGTPDYIAPEQARGDDIDHRVDIYALGCTLFFLLTGRPPYRKSADDDEKYLKVVAKHLRDPVPDPRKERREVDDDLADLQVAMMAKGADERPTYEHIIARCESIGSRLTTGLPAVADRSKATRPMGAPSVVVPAAGPKAAPAEITQQSVSLGSLGASVPGGRPTLSRALVGITILSFMVFAAGLGLLLFGPMPARPAVAPSAPPDAAPPPPVDAGYLVDTAPPPPPGMLLVRDGVARAFWVDRAPVSNAEYAQFQVKHRFAKKDADRPVTGVPYDYAVQYARFRGKRLVRADEWPAASATAAFVPAGMKLLEWVDDGAGGPGAAKERTVRGVNGASGKKKAAGDASVTFRLAMDPGS